MGARWPWALISERPVHWPNMFVCLNRICHPRSVHNSCEVRASYDKSPFLVQVTLGGLKAGTQYYVTVLLVLKDDRPGPAATFVVSTTTGEHVLAAQV